MHARCLAALVAITLCLPGRAHAAPQTEDQIRELYYEGSTRYSASDYEGAVAKFTEALHLATNYGSDPQVRGALLLNLAQSHAARHRIDHDRRHLRTAIDIFTRVLDEAESVGYHPKDVETARREKMKLEAKLDAMEARSADPGAAPVEDEPAEALLQPELPTREDEPARPPQDARRTRTGFVLVGLGAPVAAAGVAMIGAGAAFGPRARKQVQDADGPPDHESSWVADEKRKGLIWMAAGGVAVAAGLGLIVGGAIALRNRRSGTAAWRMVPTAGPGLAALGVEGRF